MAELLLVLMLQILGIIILGLKKSKRTYEFPFLASVIFLGFIAVQTIGFVYDPSGLPNGGIEKMFFMAIFLLPVLYLCRNKKPKKGSLRVRKREFYKQILSIK